MRRLLLITALLLSVVSCNNQKSKKLPRIGIVGIGIECSTFSPARTSLDMFEPIIGKAILKTPTYTQDTTILGRAEWCPAMLAWATPGGMLTKETYDSLVNQSLRLLKAQLPLDGLFLDIHGAMSVEGLDDPEGDYVLKIRKLVGKDMFISCSMDPHGCVSPVLAENLDLITSYRKSPHEDRYISRRRAINNLLNRIESGKGKPKYKAWVNVPILLPGEKTSTRVEPGKSLYASLEPVEQLDGIVDAAIWMSYPWADEPRNHGVVMVFGDDSALVRSNAQKLAEKFWSIRKDFEFVAPTATLDEVLDKAVKSNKKPYFISDMGDNPTAGGAGDVTWTLKQLLNRKEFKRAGGKRLIYASIPGPELVKEAKKKGVGATVKGKVGAIVDDRYAGPQKIKGTVKTILESPNNTQVVIQDGSMEIIVTETRTPFHYEKDFDKLNLKPREADIIVVKLGYLTEELYDMKADWMMAHTRGGVDQELTKLPYKRVIRPIFPLDENMADPDLTPVMYRN